MIYNGAVMRKLSVSSSKLKLLAFVIAGFSCSSAEAAIKVAVTYTFVEVEVSPLNQIHRDKYTTEYTCKVTLFCQTGVAVRLVRRIL